MRRNIFGLAAWSSKINLFSSVVFLWAEFGIYLFFSCDSSPVRGLVCRSVGSCYLLAVWYIKKFNVGGWRSPSSKKTFCFVLDSILWLHIGFFFLLDFLFWLFCIHWLVACIIEFLVNMYWLDFLVDLIILVVNCLSLDFVIDGCINQNWRK